MPQAIFASTTFILTANTANTSIVNAATANANANATSSQCNCQRHCQQRSANATANLVPTTATANNATANVPELPMLVP